jgi:predicted membrane protein
MSVDPTSNPSPTPPPRERDLHWDRWDQRHRDRSRRFGRRHHHGHGVIPGLVLIAWGGLLLLRELGIIDRSLRVLDFWPLLLVGLGLSMLFRSRSLWSVLVGLAVALLGAGMLAERLGYVVVGFAHLWPLVIVAAGLAVVWKGLTHRHGLPRGYAHRTENEKITGDELQRSVTMGGIGLVVDSQQFKGGALSATMGEVRADLRRAAMVGEEASLELSLTMGGIELTVPTNWQVVNDLSPFMGVVEDFTEPRPDAAGVQKRLVLRGKITMGAVRIKN